VIPFDDREVAADALGRKLGHAAAPMPGDTAPADGSSR